MIVNPGVRKESCTIWNILSIIVFGKDRWITLPKKMAPRLLWRDLEFRQTTAGFDFFEEFLGMIGWRHSCGFQRASNANTEESGGGRRGRSVNHAWSAVYLPRCKSQRPASHPMVYTTAQINQACLLMKEKDMLIPPTGAEALSHSFIFSKMGRRLAVLLCG